jgi:hypothetical protein
MQLSRMRQLQNVFDPLKSHFSQKKGRENFKNYEFLSPKALFFQKSSVLISKLYFF